MYVHGVAQNKMGLKSGKRERLCKTHVSCVEHIVTCIVRQRAGKHLVTKYTHATIELRMLLLVARQQSARQ
jgi:hypothetical protein